MATVNAAPQHQDRRRRARRRRAVVTMPTARGRASAGRSARRRRRGSAASLGDRRVRRGIAVGPGPQPHFERRRERILAERRRHVAPGRESPPEPLERLVLRDVLDAPRPPAAPAARCSMRRAFAVVDVVLQVDRHLGRLHPLDRAAAARLTMTSRNPPSDEREGDRADRQQRRPARPRRGWPTLRRTRSRRTRHPATPVRRAGRGRGDDAPADAADQLAVVRGDEHRRAARVDLAEQVHDLERQVGIEVAGRLVGEDELRIVDERARDRDALLLAARQLLGKRVHAVLQPDPLQHLERLALLLRDAARRARACTNATFSNTVMRGISLKSWKTKPTRAPVRLHLRRRRASRRSRPPTVELALARQLLAQQQAQERRLAGAARAGQEDELALVDA